MNSKVLLSIASLFLLASNDSLFAMHEIETMEGNHVKSSGKSFPLCETLYQTCEKSNSCSKCDHCAGLPHCCFSGDCIALCKDDISNYCPAIRDAYLDDGWKCALIVAVAHPPAHVRWHFHHAKNIRSATELREMK